MRIIRPNSEPQRQFLITPAFETLYGGEAGGGKSWAMVVAAILGINNPLYHAVMFRRTFAQLGGADGLMAIAQDVYSCLPGARYKADDHIWSFPSRATARFAHMQNAMDYINYQGHQFAFVGFDELSQFEEEQYRYLFSRVGRRRGVPARVAASSNPHPGWVKRRWAPWVDRKHPNPAADGELRWYRLDAGEEVEVSEEEGRKNPLTWSRTFIHSSWRNNPDLDPAYERNLDMLPLIERERLKNGNWDIVPGKGLVLRREWFPLAQSIPNGCREFRFWDFAATEKSQKSRDPDWTATAYLATDGRRFFLHVQRRRVSFGTARKWVEACLRAEPHVRAGGEKEGGSSGKAIAEDMVALARSCGRTWDPVRPSGDKVARALRWSRFAEQGDVFLLDLPGAAIEEFRTEAQQFPESPHDDMVDAVSGVFALWQSSGGSAPAAGGYDLG